MSVHPQYDEDLALYALGVLEGEERRALEAHLESCSECGHEVERLRRDLALLALSVTGPVPPARARQRLLRAVAAEPRSAPARVRVAWWSWVPTFAAAVLALLAIFAGLRNGQLERRLAQLEQESARQRADVQRAQEVLATLTATDALRVTLAAAKNPPQPQGKAIYVRDRGSLIFLASNFSPLPSEKTYELWIIPSSGSPIPAGVFKPDAHGSATVVNPPLPVGVVAKAFAITIEPEPGSAAPTSSPIMIGAGG